MSAQQRRELFFANSVEHDASISFDINEYLIQTWPTLPAKGRKSVWTLAQNDEDFDFSDIEDQIDGYVYAYAETSSSWDLPEVEDDADEAPEDYVLELDLYEYFTESWSTLTPKQIDAVVETAYNSDEIDWEPVFRQLDEIAARLSSVPPKSDLD